MKKVLFVLAMMVSMSASSQVVFSKWVMRHDVLVTSLKFLQLQYQNKGDKVIKHCDVYYYAVNEVGDCVDGTVSLNDATHTGIFRKSARSVGPIQAGKKSKKLDVTPCLFYVGKAWAVPVLVHLDYMDGTSEDIDITKENFKQYFPNSDWHDYDKPNKD